MPLNVPFSAQRNKPRQCVHLVPAGSDPPSVFVSFTQQVFEQRLVLLPDAVEGGPARASVRQRVLPHPPAAGELVEVLAGVGAAVHGLHYLTGHSDAGLRQAQAPPTVCKTTRRAKR